VGVVDSLKTAQKPSQTDLVSRHVLKQLREHDGRWDMGLQAFGKRIERSESGAGRPRNSVHLALRAASSFASIWSAIRSHSFSWVS
jgi:hypothetical protein